MSSKRLSRKPPPELGDDQPDRLCRRYSFGSSPVPPSPTPTAASAPSGPASSPPKPMGPKSIDHYHITPTRYRDRQRQFMGLSSGLSSSRLPLTVSQSSPSVLVPTEPSTPTPAPAAPLAPYPTQDVVLELVVENSPPSADHRNATHYGDYSAKMNRHHSTLSYSSYASYASATSSEQVPHSHSSGASSERPDGGAYSSPEQNDEIGYGTPDTYGTSDTHDGYSDEDRSPDIPKHTSGFSSPLDAPNYSNDQLPGLGVYPTFDHPEAVAKRPEVPPRPHLPPRPSTSSSLEFRQSMMVSTPPEIPPRPPYDVQQRQMSLASSMFPLPSPHRLQYSPIPSPNQTMMSPPTEHYYAPPPAIVPPYAYSGDSYNILDSMTDDESALPLPSPDTERNSFDYSLLPEIPQRQTSRRSRPPPMMPQLPQPIMSHRVGSSSSLASSIVSRARLEEKLPPLPLDLPHLPFTASVLMSQHFSEIHDVWRLNNVYHWCSRLKSWLHESEIPLKEFRVAIMKVASFHCPDLSMEIIWRNVDAIIASLALQQAIVIIEDDATVAIVDGVPVSGVFPELAPCYGTSHEGPLHCYAPQCTMNWKLDHQHRLASADPTTLVLGDDWASYWQLTVDELKQIDRQESKKQSLIFDLFRSEQKFIQRGRCFLEHVCRQFFKAAIRLVPEARPDQIRQIENEVYNSVHALVEAHETLLFAPLIKVLIDEGKFIRSIGDINQLYRQWSHTIKQPLLTYMSTLPAIQDILARPEVIQWIDENVNSLEEVKKLRVNGSLLFLSTFNSRYQHLPLQLADVQKYFDESESSSFDSAISAIKNVARAVNDRKRLADNRHGVSKLVGVLEWRTVVKPRNLNLDSDHRKLYYRGEMFKKGDLRINSSVVHLILLDNYFLITKRNGRGKYEVIETPIPIEQMLMEERETSAPLITNPTAPPEEEEPSTYPFKVRYAGWGKHHAYTFFSKTEQGRADWIKVFIEARTDLCGRRLKTDPYAVDGVSLTQFAYEASKKIIKLPVCAPGDPIYAIAADAQAKLITFGVKPPQDIYSLESAHHHLCFAKVYCAEQFIFNGAAYCFVGTHTGIYAWDYRGRWRRVFVSGPVTRIHVAVGQGIMLVLSNKQLRYYTLRSVLNAYHGEGSTHVVTAVKVSNDPVAFFSMGKHRDMTMLFYAKHKSNNSFSFKALVPEVDSGGVFSRFREVKKFYVQAECLGMTLFNTTFAIHTTKGVEVMFLDDLKARSVPVVPQVGSKVANRAAVEQTMDAVRRMTQKTNIEPLGMYKLRNNMEFLLVYATGAVFTDKKGVVSRGTMINFHHKATAVAFEEDKLFVVCDESIEVWSISHVSGGTNKLMQVISGKGIRLLSPHQLCFCIANPLAMGMQLVFNLRRVE
ncbi:hypothetical protein DIRU0_E06546 [Diutina rugosa]